MESIELLTSWLREARTLRKASATHQMRNDQCGISMRGKCAAFSGLAEWA
jgi:hypothetical protein